MLVLDCPISDDQNADEDEDERFARPATIWTDTDRLQVRATGVASTLNSYSVSTLGTNTPRRRVPSGTTEAHDSGAILSSLRDYYSALFGNPMFNNPKIRGPHSLQKRSHDRRCHFVGNATANHAKYTKRNPRPPEPTHRTLSLWPLCLSGKNNHGDTENTEKPRTFGTPPNRTSGSGDSPNIRSPRRRQE